MSGSTTIPNLPAATSATINDLLVISQGGTTKSAPLSVVLGAPGGLGIALSSPPPIGNIAPSSGAFTSLSSASGALNGTIGGTAPADGAFVGLTSMTGALNGSIGSVTPNPGAFTSLTSTSGALNGTLGATTPNTAAILSVEFNGGGSSRLLSYVPADTALEYSVAGTKVLSVLDTGALGASVLATGSTTLRTLADRAADWVNVKDFGAVLNGTTNDLSKFSAARAAATTNGSILVPAGGYFLTGTPTGGPASPVLWKLSGNSFGTGTTPVTGIGTDTVATVLNGARFYTRTATVPNAGPVFRVDNTVTSTGGTPGNVISSLMVNATAAAGTSGNHVWGLTSVLNSSSNSGVENVAIAGYAHRLVAGDEIWATNLFADDLTGLKSSLGGALVTAELDIRADNADDGGAANALIPLFAGIRVGLAIIGSQRGIDTTGPAEFGYMIQAGAHNQGTQTVGPWDTTHAYAKRVFTAIGGFSIAAYDASLATAMGSANAFRMAADQTFAFDGLTNSRTLSYVSADTALEYQVSGTPRFRINDGGGIVSNLAFGNQGSALALTYSGGTTAIFTPKVAVSGALSGQIVGGPAAVGVTSWTINSDSLDTTTGAGAPKGINDFYIGHTISAGATGGRNGVNVFLNQTGATTLAAGQFYVGVASNVVASFNAGGVSGTPAGAVMGFNPRAVLQSGATFFNSAVGMEVDFGARAGSSVAVKYGLTVVLDQLDAVDGSIESAGLVFGLNASAGPTSTGLLRGISFGGSQGWWPINPTLGTLIGVAAPINGSGPAYTALYGVDVSAVTFSGAAFKSTGFSVDGTGLIVGNTKASGATTSRTLASQAADLYNAKNFGAAGNGSTVDLTALINACAPIGNVFLPATTTSYYIGESIYAGHASNQRFAGGFSGGLISSLESSVQTQQARNLARFYVAPTAPGATLWTGNFSGVHLPLQTIIAGASTLTKPTTSYYQSRVTSAIVIDYQNSSGWQEQVLGSGRTGAASVSVSLNQAGMGDLVAITASGTVSGQNTFPPTNPLGLPVVGFASGTMGAAASNTYINLIEYEIADNNFDAQVSGGTYNFYRQNTTGSVDKFWWGVRYGSFNSSIDAFVSVGGISRIGIDLSTGNYIDYNGTTPTNAAIVFSLGQGIFGNSVNRSQFQTPRQSSLGNEWFGWKGHYGWTMTAGSFSTAILNAHQYGVRAINLGTAGALGGNAVTSGITLQTRDGVVAKTAVVNTIAPTATGGSYLTIPTLVVAAPPGSGTQATASVATMQLGYQTRIAAAGTAYTVGDVLTLSGGTAGTAAQATVTYVDPITKAVTGISVTTAGSYTVLPTSPISTTGGTGTGCTLTGHWGVLTVTVTGAGSNYPEFPPPDVTTTGGTPDDQQMGAFTTTMTATQQPLTIGAGANVALMAAGSYGGGTGVVFIANDSVDPTSNPTGGGILYVKAGALRYRGSSGTDTLLAAA